MSNETKLISLEEWNKQRQILLIVFGAGNGIACSLCGRELRDTDRMLLSHPPQVEVTCQSCSFTGSRSL